MNSRSPSRLTALVCSLIAVVGCISPPAQEAVAAPGTSDCPSIPESPHAAGAGNVPAPAPEVTQPDPNVPQFPSVAEAQKSGTTAARFVVTDGITSLVYEKGTSGDATATVGGATYATTFPEGVIPLLAQDIPADATDTLKAALETAKKRQSDEKREIVTVRLSPAQSYTVSDEIGIPTGITFDGAGTTVKYVIPDSPKGPDNPSEENVFRINPGSSNVTLTNITINLDLKKDSPVKVRGVLASAGKEAPISNLLISNLNILNTNYRGITIVGREGKVNDVQILNNRISMPTNLQNEQGVVAIGIYSGIAENDKFSKLPTRARAYERFVQEGRVGKIDPETTRITVSGNHITSGYYGIEFSGVSCSMVSNNFSTMNTRNLSMQDNSHNNVVQDNHFNYSLSASIHLAYGSHDNQIQRNTIITGIASGEGLLQAYQGSTGNTFSKNTIETFVDDSVNTKGTEGKPKKPKWMLYVGPASDKNIFTGNNLSGNATNSIFAAESIWDHESAISSMKDSKNPYSYMFEKRLRPWDNFPANYAGGRGDLTGTQVVDNVFLPTGTPFYVGAEASRGVSSNSANDDKGKKQDERLIGNNTHLNLSGNQLAGTGYVVDQTLVEHEGSLDGVGKASISYDNKSIGTHHSQVTTQQGDAKDTNLVFDSPEDTATDAGGNDTLNASVDSTLPDGVESLRMLGSSPLQGAGNELPNTMYGNSADNVIDGKGGDDTVAGGQGKDTLTGGAGNDRFVLDGQLNGDVDTITDFTSGQDKIVLPVATFGGLSGDWFTSGEPTANTRVYQQGEKLFFDADGSGKLSSPVEFAKLPAGVQLTASDFA